MSTINKLIKGTEVKELFENEAICMGSSDVILQSKIEELFGKEVERATRCVGKYGADWRCTLVYGYYLVDNTDRQFDPNEDSDEILACSPEKSVICFTYSGFKQAIAEHNKFLIFKMLDKKDKKEKEKQQKEEQRNN